MASGSLAPGVPEDFFARVGEIAKQKNAKYILDTCGAPLKLALSNSLYMIKPNMGELATLTAVKKLTKETAISAAKKIIHNKQAEVVVVSMGAEGALLVTDSLAEHFIAPEVKIKSTVGAGDSMVAGIVMALAAKARLKKQYNMELHVELQQQWVKEQGFAIKRMPCNYFNLSQV